MRTCCISLYRLDCRWTVEVGRRLSRLGYASTGTHEIATTNRCRCRGRQNTSPEPPIHHKPLDPICLRVTPATLRLRWQAILLSLRTVAGAADSGQTSLSAQAESMLWTRQSIRSFGRIKMLPCRGTVAFVRDEARAHATIALRSVAIDQSNRCPNSVTRASNPHTRPGPSFQQ